MPPGPVRRAQNNISFDFFESGITGPYPCVVDDGICRSEEGRSRGLPEHKLPCQLEAENEQFSWDCAVLPDNITAQSQAQIGKRLSVQFQSLATRVYLKMEEQYRRFREEEMHDFQKVEGTLASLKGLRDEDLPDALLPIMDAAEKSYARHFELGLSLEKENTPLTEAMKNRVQECETEMSQPHISNQRNKDLSEEILNLNLFPMYWEKYRLVHVERLIGWLDKRVRQWNHAFGYQYLLPRITSYNQCTTELTSRFIAGITGKIGEYFVPSDTTERIAQAIGQRGEGLRSAAIVADIRELIAAVGIMRREGFSWGTASGVLLASIGLIPGVADAAKALRKLAKESLAAARDSRRMIQVKDAMKRRAAEYHTRITGLPVDQVYDRNGVKFNGFKNGILLEAKGLGYGNFVDPGSGEFSKWWKRGAQRLVDQAMRQQGAANGDRIQWHFAEKSAADAGKKLFESEGIRGIDILVTVTPQSHVS